MNARRRWIWIAIGWLLLAGCQTWPPAGQGGFAEHTNPAPDCVELNSGSQIGTLDQRLGCALRRQQILERTGAHLKSPALVIRANQHANRVRRELVGGLYDDASIDLEIYCAILDEIERQMMLSASGAAKALAEERLAANQRLVEERAALAAPKTDNMAEVLGILNNSAFFAHDSYEPNPLYVSLLTRYAGQLSRVPMMIVGHADDTGSEEYNLRLGMQRADAVRQLLIQHGIDNTLLCVTSSGKSTPAFSGEQASHRLVNRRVAIHQGRCDMSGEVSYVD
ncbi:OmpA family protein [Bowmanella sp. JS7-9]|uniref:OmpA family protein n=1 Tax=Pseudobowmanella zhangzhouensis TaxID=1537679 RepID=A0ABW1XKU2_9ALTE|nr:OmpA family protein [Bowmanella sp. JS7-9]TBX24687.1 hypothetical protein TK45_04495 [Bowmanella sp. JS7-9]